MPEFVRTLCRGTTGCETMQHLELALLHETEFQSCSTCCSPKPLLLSTNKSSTWAHGFGCRSQFGNRLKSLRTSRFNLASSVSLQQQHHESLLTHPETAIVPCRVLALVTSGMLASETVQLAPACTPTDLHRTPLLHAYTTRECR